MNINIWALGPVRDQIPNLLMEYVISYSVFAASSIFVSYAGNYIAINQIIVQTAQS